MTNEEIMNLGAREAYRTMKINTGGPFGAVVVKDGVIISVASNRVLRDNDPTAHAEISAIRDACKKLGTYDLSGCELYATGYPCPMCLSATIWANIKKVYVSGLPEDAERIGFRDDYIYRYIEDGRINDHVLEIINLDRQIAQNLYDEYDSDGNTIY